MAEKGIRVNAVAPGPIWTPLIVATFDDIQDFDQDTPMKRAGQPSDLVRLMSFWDHWTAAI
ncbi:SDR family oxidoreductase [Mongoliibacter ruber]|uniref:SDR family oxidoreductase n=1 Tax=Mongoliibacter ruber TaxID=1750599 RepID=UPI003CCBFF11